MAVVWIDAAGHVGAQDVAPIGIKPDRLVYYCERGGHFTLAYRLHEWKRGVEADPGSSDELRDLNTAFKAARRVDPSIKYVDYLKAQRAAVLEALAEEGLRADGLTLTASTATRYRSTQRPL